LGGSSDYLVVDVTAADGLHIGDELTFSLSYGALLAAMTSEYVKKVVCRHGSDTFAEPAASPAG
jgi:predicted amino acid racemase